MPEHMRRNVQIDICKITISADHTADRLIGDRCSVLINKEWSVWIGAERNIGFVFF